MKTNILAHGVVMHTNEGDCQYFGWPTVARLDDGRLMVAASGPRAAHVCPFGKSSITYSEDNGVTWSPYRIITNTSLDDRDTGLVNLGGGKLAITWFTNTRLFQRIFMTERHAEGTPWRVRVENYLDSVSDEEEKRDLGSLIRYSNDNGETWGDFIKVPVSAPHGFRVLSDGTYLYFGKECGEMLSSGEPGYEENRPISAYASADGINWEYRGSVPFAEGVASENCYEPHVIERKDGSLLGFIRVQQVEGYPFHIFKSVSEDGGRSWTVMEPTTLAGSPPHLYRHSSGVLICSFAERRGKDSCIKVAFSYDEGETWEQAVLDDRAHEGDLGYASTVEAADGTMVTTYYQRVEGETKTSVLCTRWTFDCN